MFDIKASAVGHYKKITSFIDIGINHGSVITIHNVTRIFKMKALYLHLHNSICVSRWDFTIKVRSHYILITLFISPSTCYTNQRGEWGVHRTEMRQYPNLVLYFGKLLPYYLSYVNYYCITSVIRITVTSVIVITL